TPPLSAWEGLPSHIERNFRRLLEMFDQAGVKTTCFFLGWVGERFPHLVREAAEGGHEIASHGYAHRLVHSQTRDEFYADALRAREVLEEVAGVPVRGYRSAGFSINEDTGWFFEALLEAGYAYDSSVFPASHGHGGLHGANRAPHKRQYASGTLAEFPITVADFAGKPMCFFGGGYLRLFPYGLIRRQAGQVLREGRPVVFYIHPREIDPDHPRLPMGWKRRFKSYVNLRSTPRKIERILREFRLTTFRDYLARYGETLPHERCV
ncbi:MAG: DUF3473 domain-containing protein, partial [Isosphaeraceae bacterium]|nr:DUF3473 domain-containing protein [Isosphaeraceae bacterium]